MTDATSLDPDALTRLGTWGGDKLVGQMVRLFLDNSGTRMGQIRAGDAQGDVDLAEKGSHSLKSSAANVGAQVVRELAGEIENAATSGDMDAYSRAIAELETIINGLEGAE